MTNIQQLQQRRRFYQALLAAGDAVPLEQREHAERNLKALDKAIKEGETSALFAGVDAQLNTDLRYAGGQRLPSEVRARIAQLKQGLAEAVAIRDDKNRGLLDRRDMLELIPRIEAEIAKNNSILAELNRAGLGQAEAELKERQQERQRVRADNEARAARAAEKKAYERQLDAALDKATRLVQIERAELVKAYAAHLKSATPRGDGSSFSNHTDANGQDYHINVEKTGRVYVEPGHSSEG